MMHVAVDLDDVTLEFFPGVLHSFYTEYGVNPQYDAAPWGEYALAFTKHPMFKESGYKDWWGWLKDREWLWATFPAVPGAIGGIKRLRAAGHYVECVTSKPTWAEHNVWKWLGKWRPPFNRVTIVSNGQSKLHFTPADVIVDDKRATCDEFVAAGRRAVLFDRTASVSGFLGHGSSLYVAYDWEHVLSGIRQMEAAAARGDEPSVEAQTAAVYQ